MKNFIIHISGASGSGKTTLGNQLKNKFKNKIIVKDLDDLIDEFIKKFYNDKKWTFINENEYQLYIDSYIDKQNNPIIFVGLNDNIVYGKNKNLYYNVHSQYNYYIDIDDMIILKQKCIRFLTDELPDMVTKNKAIIRDITEDNEKFVRLIKENIERECNAKLTIKQNNKWKKDYKKQNYTFLSRQNIYKSVVQILNTVFSK